MRTAVTTDESGSVCVKEAEGPGDVGQLARLRENIALLGRLVPSMAPKVLLDAPDRLVISAVEGRTHRSEEAAVAYAALPWVPGAILTEITTLGACAAPPQALRGPRVRLFRRFLRGLRVGVVLPVTVQRHLLALMGPGVPWALSHGDLTEWNIVVDAERRRAALIDWEELAYRPALWDVFFLAFHRRVPLERLSWQRDFLAAALARRSGAELPAWAQSVAVACMAEHLANDARRARACDSDARAALDMRRRALARLAGGVYWREWTASLASRAAQATAAIS